MLFDDTIKTIAHPCTGEWKEKGSAFHAFASPATTEKEAKEIINFLRKDHPKANHHCFAYRIGPGDQLYRYSDDREPSGTAGKPIFGAIKSSGLTNILLVVVRYFGGTLLGVPGLIRCYRNAALNAISNCTVITIPITENYLLTYDYDMLKEVQSYIRSTEAEITGQRMEDLCYMQVSIRKSAADDFIREIRAFHPKGKIINIETL